VTFEGIDVEARPEGLKDLERLGIPLVPATVLGDRWVHGWNPKALAELVDVTYAEGPRLSPEALAQRLDLILAAAQRAVSQVAPEHLEMRAPTATDRFVSSASISSGSASRSATPASRGTSPRSGCSKTRRPR
jgi:hypothetical protein